MSFESYSLIVWRFELVGLNHKFAADVDGGGGGGIVGVGCRVVVRDGVGGGGGGGDGNRCRRVDCC